ncbi:MAG TPA: LacI family DNA-binding transcriptional regulator [Chloroflexota bacterium]|nr:LacI family DNA-binding transcriptional regulator [Chloroflexota bacterium]
MAVKLKDVAELAGVSLATASRALNSEVAYQVAKETRERVWEAVHRLGYRVQTDTAAKENNHDRQERPRASVGLILDDVDDLYAFPFWLRVLAGIEKELIVHQYHLLFSYTANDLKYEYKRRLVSRKNIDGLIYVNTRPPEGDIPMEGIVTVDGSYGAYVRNGLRFDHIGLEMRYAMYQMVDHLVQLGRRRFAYLGPAIEADERTQSVHQGLARRDLAIVPGCDPVAPWPTDGAYVVAFDLLSRHAAEIDALICASDEIAVGAMRAAKELGLRLPDDLAITGFNDEPFARDLDPALTTISVPKELVGELAARRLIERITSPELPLTIQLVPTTLLIRASCGAGRAERPVPREDQRPEILSAAVSESR